MNKEQLISHWITIVSAVFSAEDAIKPTWLPKLVAAPSLPKAEREQLAADYLRAVATEIVTKGYEDDADKA